MCDMIPLCPASKTYVLNRDFSFVCLYCVQAVNAGLVPLLLACMTKGSMALTAASAEALMQITVGVKGKQAMVSCISKAAAQLQYDARCAASCYICNWLQVPQRQTACALVCCAMLHMVCVTMDISSQTSSTSAFSPHKPLPFKCILCYSHCRALEVCCRTWGCTCKLPRRIETIKAAAHSQQQQQQQYWQQQQLCS